MESQYYIVFNFKTADGWRSFAKFFIGNDREVAQRLFRLLEGSRDPEEPYPLTVDLMETLNGLPVSLKMINCSLPQLGENTKTITRELFREAALSQ